MNDSFVEALHTRGYRMTPQRWVILNVLQNNHGHLTPVDVYQRAQRLMPGLTEPTVYRTLTFLAEQGLVLAAHVGSGQLVYEIAAHDHHHLICRSCGQELEIDHAVLAELYQIFRDRTGYQIDRMHITFFGLCPECQVSDET